MHSHHFLGATKHLYNWLCPLVGPLVGQLVCRQRRMGVYDFGGATSNLCYSNFLVSRYIVILLSLYVYLLECESHSGIVVLMNNYINGSK